MSEERNPSLVDGPLKEPVIIAECLGKKIWLEEVLEILERRDKFKEYDIIPRAVIINDEPYIRYALRRTK